MNEYEERAWSILDEMERSVLILNLTHGKSIREVGSILKKPHYRCLQVKERAESLFKLMINHYSNYGSLFSPNSPTNKEFRSYIESLIEDRSTIKEAHCKSETANLMIPRLRERYIIKNMEYLGLSHDEWDKSTHNIILEFDRYNNFRILPKVLQRVSPFKRKYTKDMLRYLEGMTNHNDVRLDYLLSLVGKTKKEETCIYVVLFSYERFDFGYKVLPIYFKNKNLNIFKENKYYLWDDIENADYFGTVVANFMYKEKNSGIAQKFWGKYREHIKLAINYKEVNNIQIGEYNIEQILLDKRFKDGPIKDTRRKKIDRLQKNYFD